MFSNVLFSFHPSTRCCWKAFCELTWLTIQILSVGGGQDDRVAAVQVWVQKPQATETSAWLFPSKATEPTNKHETYTNSFSWMLLGYCRPTLSESTFAGSCEMATNPQAWEMQSPGALMPPAPPQVTPHSPSHLSDKTSRGTPLWPLFHVTSWQLPDMSLAAGWCLKVQAL